ncbi:carbonic anhydrase/acetyltransferase-like protein (isoleucine patch superfamily) [Thermosporothrix hazakensis]|jgi:carbonic anhydrase/acetyltransferase-like protein (isoleucine patch superfamily)|uniref:Carbonic anhydrase/acetyltransferase-like protein (Isoleucine patch superfamily) n=1 Tax=Thermosporothrix hazakensis TaxID=644383 RepID=A0A326U0G9_THEHA|nr:gamma carbonic anhydrase family protein [Thermosporothrix hazakensis]PZW23922.1 carbonic anhydrase/acetyltransferase-like protein (isoleucine patch superfamily) [Thermosporothrix hazakensis]GCE48479.1 gamma carbonic anhydrase family protein [Thermosporothrix hazakensis]
MPILPFNGITPRIADDVFIAPGAMIIGDVTIGAGSSVWYNAVIRGDTAPIVIGKRTNIQDNCTLHTDPDAPLTIGDECTIGHNAIVHGATLQNRVLVGMHATVLSHAEIGTETIIGAGALIGERKQIPGGVLALGLPAKAVRELQETEKQQIAASAQHYQERGQQHQRSLEETADGAR